MTRTHNNKLSLRLVLAIAAFVVVCAVPAQASADQNCANAGTDPTAAQYCQVSGAHESGNNGDKPATQAGNESGDNPQPDSAKDSGKAPESVATTEEVGPVTTQAVESSSSGSLPFTGLDVGILAAVAAGLVGTGLVLRRVTASGVSRS